MADTAGTAAIDGITGPGKRTLLFQDGVQEITFFFKKRVIGVTTRDGNFGSYDLVQVNSIQITGDGDNIMLSITSKEQENAGPNSNQTPDGTAGTSASTGSEGYGSRQGSAGRTEAGTAAKSGTTGSDGKNTGADAADTAKSGATSSGKTGEAPRK